MEECDRMSNKLKELKQEMIAVYGLKCWLCGIEDKRLTGHHILPLREFGPTTWENIALLSRKQHDLFNMIELSNPKMAKKLNGLFKELNMTMAPPDDGYFEEVNHVLKKVR